MEHITLLLFERMGVLLIIAFILTRIPRFRQLLDRKMTLSSTIYFSFVFGLFGILGTYAGVVVQGDTLSVYSSFWIFPLKPDDAMAHSALVGVVIGGLMGGQAVGALAGVITGAHLLYMGGFSGLAGGVAAPIIGLLAGWLARFFFGERVISPAKALFIGMFAPIVQMGAILIFSAPPDKAIRLVDMIGIPMVLTNSISIAIFTMMLRVALKEEERTAAHETQRALSIAELALPHLKQGLSYKTADAIARLLLSELEAAAVAITDTERILAHVGSGAPRQSPGEPIVSELSRKAIRTGELQIEGGGELVQPGKDGSGSAIIVPFMDGEKTAGLIQIYFKRTQEIRSVEIVLAQGLGKLISYQLGMVMHEKMVALMKQAELRVLQAQINPHFLFNTLNSILSLIRVDPETARHVTTQLGTFMRLNLKITSSPLVTVKQEMDHLHAYLEIINIRFADQFSVTYVMDPEAESFLIPPATFQPLVENSIKHGFHNRTNGGFIRITLHKIGERAEIAIEDNGAGIPEETLHWLGEKPVHSPEGNGIGVYNVNQRLVSLFGGEAKLHYSNMPEGGCRIQFAITRKESEGETRH